MQKAYKGLKDLNVNGRIMRNLALAQYTWLKTGGNADIFFIPKDVEGLKSFLKNLCKEINIFPLGAGSNTLFRDLGYKGAVIKLGKSFDYIKFSVGSFYWSFLYKTARSNNRSN